MRRCGEPCSKEYCGKPVFARGFCNSHWYRVTQAEKGLPVLEKLIWDEIGVTGAHGRVRKLWGPAKKYPCIECGRKAVEWAYDGTDPSQLYGCEPSKKNSSWTFYSRYPEFYMPMCRSCHRRMDGAKARRELHEYRLQRHAEQLARQSEENVA